MLNTATHTPETEGWVSIVLNIGLFFLKFWAGLASGSIAIVADAWHTLSDSISSVFVIIGTRISNKPADKEHPFGHGRSELITAILIGGFLAVIGWSFLSGGIERLKTQQAADYGTLAIVVTIVSIVSKEALAQYAFWVGKRHKAGSVIADGWHHRSDAVSSVVVLVGILLGGMFWWVDAVLAIVVAVMIFWAAYGVIRDAALVILGEEPSNELIDNVIAIAETKVERHLYAHHFHVHNYINHKELTFHVRFPKEMTIAESHQLITLIEQEILEQTQMVATIHAEPIKDHGNQHTH